jgi:hypothetical protein
MPGRCACWTLVAIASTLGACSDDGGKARDASIDTLPGVCGGVTSFTGDIVDWDSTEASFCGVNNAVFKVHSDPACTSTTAPNGRFQLLIPQEAKTVVDIVPPTAGSGCTALAGKANTYKLPAVVIASAAVIAAGGAYSARAMAEFRVAEMFAQIGQPLKAGRAQLVVHVNGIQHPLQISGAHDATQRFDGTAWAAGDTGRDVFFPNIDLSLGLVIVDTTGPSTGTGTYLLEPDKVTYLAIIGN